MAIQQKKAQKTVIYLLILLFAAAAVYFRIGFDLAVLLFMFFAFWCIGSFLPAPTALGRIETNLIRLAIGMAAFGLESYYLLLIGWGVRSIYLLLLILPIGMRLRALLKEDGLRLPKTPAFSVDQLAWLIAVTAVVIFYLGYASAPIDKYDALTGHLPITMYAARNGRFNLNICESQTYSQTGMLLYAFSTVLAEFSAFKGMTLFNVVLFFLIIATAIVFSQHLYAGTNPFLIGVLFVTVPMFFEFSTTFYVEMLPIYMAFSAFLLFVDLSAEQCWGNMPYIALLFACAPISKLTITYMLVFPGLIAIVLFWNHCMTMHISAQRAFVRFVGSGLLFAAIISVPYIWTWYWYGNPFYPMFNGTFQSIYYSPVNFVDPFQNHALSFSVKSVIDMTFHTSQNVEMHDGGLGTLLLMIPLIPISWLVRREKRWFMWSVVPFCTYGLSLIFTFNLRYYMSIYMLLTIVTGTSISVIIDKFLNHNDHRTVIAAVVLLSVPGIIYISAHYPILAHMLNISDEISVSPFSELLDAIPKDQHVFCPEPFKGDYDGYLSPNNWQGTAWKRIAEMQGVSARDYVSSFDYFICNMNDVSQTELLRNCTANGVQIEGVRSENNYTLFKISHGWETLRTVIDTGLSIPEASTVSAPVTETFKVEGDSYIIRQEVENPNMFPLLMRFQINWSDSDGIFLGVSSSNYTLQPHERGAMISGVFEPPKGAAYGILYVCPNEDDEILVYKYELKTAPDYIDLFSDLVMSRVWRNTDVPVLTGEVE